MQKILTALDLAAKAAERGETAERHEHVSKVCRVLTGFQQALDVENGGQIADNLSSLYRFAIKRLVEFEIRNDPKIAHEVVSILMPLAAAWHELAEPSEVGLSKKAQAVIIATGSEVQLALKAQALLAQHKVAVRVVSMPSTTTFDRQSVAYKRSVLPDGVPRIAVEMGVTDFWWKYGVSAVVGIDTYGESAPAGVLFKHFGFTAHNVADTVHQALLKR